jgi:hypothetical protein
LLAVPNPKYFFWSGEGNDKSVAGDMTKDLKKVFLKAKIADGRSHRFDDTAAVELLKAGVDIRKVSQFLGHAPASLPRKNIMPRGIRHSRTLIQYGRRDQRGAGLDGDAHLGGREAP